MLKQPTPNADRMIEAFISKSGLAEALSDPGAGPKEVNLDDLCSQAIRVINSKTGTRYNDYGFREMSGNLSLMFFNRSKPSPKTYMVFKITKRGEGLMTMAFLSNTPSYEPRDATETAWPFQMDAAGDTVRELIGSARSSFVQGMVKSAMDLKRKAPDAFKETASGSSGMLGMTVTTAVPKELRRLKESLMGTDPLMQKEVAKMQKMPSAKRLAYARLWAWRRIYWSAQRGRLTSNQIRTMSAVLMAVDAAFPDISGAIKRTLVGPVAKRALDQADKAQMDMERLYSVDAGEPEIGFEHPWDRVRESAGASGMMDMKGIPSLGMIAPR